MGAAGSSLPSPPTPQGGSVLAKPAPVILTLTPQVFFLLVGSIILGILIFVPIWDTSRLLYDPVFVYFVGRAIPSWTIVVCVAILVTYVAMILSFFHFVSEQGKTQQTLLLVVLILVMGLGLAFVLLSRPLQVESQRTYDELMFSCEDGPRTQRLFEYYLGLLALRSTPECMKKYTVEDCEGYKESPYTGFLKEMEISMKCSGFCKVNQNMTWASMVPETENEATSEEQVSSTSTTTAVPTLALRQEPRSLGKGHPKNRWHRKGTHSLLAIGAKQPDWSRAGEIHEDYEYPPTIFTVASYQASCDGMAARHLRFMAFGVVDLLYYEGVLMLVSCVVVGITKIFGISFAKANWATWSKRKARRTH